MYNATCARRGLKGLTERSVRVFGPWREGDLPVKPTVAGCGECRKTRIATIKMKKFEFFSLGLLLVTPSYSSACFSKELYDLQIKSQFA